MAEELKVSVAEQAKEKLTKDLDNQKGPLKSFLKPVIDHLIKRAGEDEGMAADILQEHKTLVRMNDYLRKKARAYESGNCVAVPDYEVYEWAEDYIRLDDKALAEKDKKEKEQREAKLKKDQEEAKKKAEEAKKKAEKEKKEKEEAKKRAEEEKKAQKEAEKAEKARKKNQVDGQMSIFDFLGA